MLETVAGMIFILATAAFAQTPESWKVPLQVRIESIRLSLNLGVHPEATSGFDIGIDTVAPPPAFTPYAAFLISGLPNTLQSDFRAPDSSIIWRLLLHNIGTKTGTITWSISTLPPFAKLVINKTVDMYQDSTYAFSGNQIIEIVYTRAFVPSGLRQRSPLPQFFDLYIFPNPFVEKLNILVRPTSIGPVHVEIYDLMGKRVFAGKGQQFIWDGRNLQGISLPSGIYFISATKERIKVVKKVHLIR